VSGFAGLRRRRFLKDFGGRFAATAAADANTERALEIPKGTRAALGALPDGSVGDAVADADIHENYYHSIISKMQLLFEVSKHSDQTPLSPEGGLETGLTI